MSKITRQEYVDFILLRKKVSTEKELLDKHGLIIISCDGSCEYESCKGWVLADHEIEKVLTNG